MSKKRSFVLLAAALAASMSSAHAAGEKPVSFKDDVQPILNSQCVFCHVTGAENGGLNLGRRESHASLLSKSTEAPSMPRVTPGDPSQSYLVHKLKGTQLDAGGSGAQMPLYDPPKPFPAEHLEIIERWIKEGAQKN